MPLQRHNLRVVAPAVPSGASLEELLGPPTLRPGELHESVAFEVPTVIRAAATATGTPLALAVTVVVERELALVALTETGAAFAGVRAVFLESLNCAAYVSAAWRSREKFPAS